MSDPFDFDDEPADDGRPQLPRRPRYYDEPEAPPVDPKLFEWAKNERTIIADHAAARKVVR